MTSPVRLRLYSTAGLVLLAGCLVLLNLLGSRFYLRLDLSEGKLYSLSAASKRLLKSIDKPVEIRSYLSKDLPPEYAAHRAFVKDLLEEYRNASRGKLTVRSIEVGQDAESKNEAAEEGVAPLEFNVLSKEKFEIRQGFLGIVLQHEDKKEVIPAALRGEGLEYDISSRLVQLTRPDKKALGLVSSHGAIGPEGLNGRVREFLERHYALKPVDLRGLPPGAKLPDELAGLMLLGATETLPPYHLYSLDQFLLSGKPIVYALDARKSDLQSFLAAGLATGLPKLLEHYGASLKQNLVLDAQSQKVQLSQQRGWITFTNVMEYPLFVNVKDLDREHPVTRYLDALTLPLVSPVELRAKGSVLARSSEYSWLSAAWGRGAVHSISPLQIPALDEKEDARGPFGLMAALDGPFASYFTADPKGEHPLPAEADRAAFLAKGRPGGRLFVVGTSRFAQAELPSGEAGAVFLLNLADWLAFDSELIAIRAKGVQQRPLSELPAANKTAIKWTNVLGPSFLVAAFGFGRLRLRRLASARRAKLYGHAAQDA